MKSERGMTLIEIMIALAIMGLMLALAWTSISNTSSAKRDVEAEQERHHELRVALSRVVEDLQSAYLSKNEDEAATHRRTLMVGKSGGKVPDLRFSTLAHRVLWADANESDATVVTYMAMDDREKPSQTNWVRREQRRMSNKQPDEEPSELDIVIRDIEEVKFEFWDWKDEEWQDSWDTTSSDGEKGRLPLRVRITVKVKLPSGSEVTLSTQARVLLQEPLNFVQ